MTFDRKTFLTFRNILVAGAFASVLLFVLKSLLLPSSGDEEAIKSPAYLAGVSLGVTVIVATIYAVYGWAWRKNPEGGSSVAKDEVDNAAAKTPIDSEKDPDDG